MNVLALRDYREHLISTGALKPEEAHSPWTLPTVKDYLTWKYQQQKHELVKAILSIHLKKRMTFEQLSRAVDLARLAVDENPWVGVGPDRSRALCFNSADSKMLPAGMVESNGAVRALHWEHCPVSAAADLVVLELHPPGKLRWIASHERDVTRMHYLSLATDAVHRMGGFGPEWSSAHLLGRSGHDTLRLKAGGQL
ncbi:hypothetical protein WJX72_009124 [[Myrmecia] bisecta]|uniref:Uncharacterized protein n=1 Tax=[Myrmecia] bisecta TaxID=41462 RepID=A0AAW1PC40_9CHLO